MDKFWHWLDKEEKQTRLISDGVLIYRVKTNPATASLQRPEKASLIIE